MPLMERGGAINIGESGLQRLSLISVTTSVGGSVGAPWALLLSGPEGRPGITQLIGWQCRKQCPGNVSDTVSLGTQSLRSGALRLGLPLVKRSRLENLRIVHVAPSHHPPDLQRIRDVR